MVSASFHALLLAAAVLAPGQSHKICVMKQQLHFPPLDVGRDKVPANSQREENGPQSSVSRFMMWPSLTGPGKAHGVTADLGAVGDGHPCWSARAGKHWNG